MVSKKSVQLDHEIAEALGRFTDDRPESLRRRQEASLKRGAMLWRLRKDGHTFREIGELMGISTSRAQQIVRKHERILRHLSALGTLPDDKEWAVP